jgi:acyl-CoA dehydrogenase
MDVQGGKGIMLGPNNYLARGYQSVPIAITVEGANILTRNLMIFGQGAIRCHPFVMREMTSARNPDRRKGVDEFDRALFGHMGFAISNAVRSRARPRATISTSCASAPRSLSRSMSRC